MIENFLLLRNVCQFGNFSGNKELKLDRFSLIYAENGGGKTTLAEILESLSSGDAKLVQERHRLGSDYKPHIVINANGNSHMFRNGDWNEVLPSIAVFDDAFVAKNIYFGLEIDSEHRQALHELIIGEKGVQLNEIVKKHIAKIEEHNKELKRKEKAIPADIRGSMSVDDFCALKYNPRVKDEIKQAKQNLAAARSADKVLKEKHFPVLGLSSFDVKTIDELLGRGLPEIDQNAAKHVQEHLASLGKGGEAWTSDGMKRIERASKNH